MKAYEIDVGYVPPRGCRLSIKGRRGEREQQWGLVATVLGQDPESLGCAPSLCHQLPWCPWARSPRGQSWGNRHRAKALPKRRWATKSCSYIWEIEIGYLIRKFYLAISLPLSILDEFWPLTQPGSGARGYIRKDRLISFQLLVLRFSLEVNRDPCCQNLGQRVQLFFNFANLWYCPNFCTSQPRRTASLGQEFI